MLVLARYFLLEAANLTPPQVPGLSAAHPLSDSDLDDQNVYSKNVVNPITLKNKPMSLCNICKQVKGHSEFLIHYLTYSAYSMVRRFDLDRQAETS